MENRFLPVTYLHVSLPHKSRRFSDNLLSKSTCQFIYQEGEAFGVCLEKSRGAGGASREANIFSGLVRHCKNTLLMLMCIRSEPGKY